MTGYETKTPPSEEHFKQYVAALSEFESAEATFHPIGIRDSGAFEQYAQLESTVYADNIPTLVHLQEAEELVNVDRGNALVADIADLESPPSVYVGIVPLQYIAKNHDELRAALGPGSHYVIAEHDEGTPQSEMIEGELSGRLHPLVHPVTKTKAAYNFFQATAKNTDPDSWKPPVSIERALNEGRVQASRRTEDGGLLDVRQGGQFSPEEAQQLWELFNARFTDISDNLPVDLAESEEATYELLNDPRHYLTFKTEADGRISCAAIFTDVPEACPWINPAFTDVQNEKLAQDPATANAKTVFVPGIAAYKQEGLRASASVLQSIADTCVATGAPALAFQFECTDVSSLYIPELVNQALVTNSNTDPLESKLLAQKKYVLVELS